MTPEQFQRVRELFERAAGMPAEEWEGFLDVACPDDAEVRDEVLRLLRRRQEEDAKRESATFAPTLPFQDSSGRPRVDALGPYRLRRVIGEGGMGIVYEAVQDEPVHRVVALKLVRAGLDGRQVIARLEMERQALAVMSHPGIAKFLDAGTDADGRPWFAMEHIQGVPITDYCDRQRLGTRQRLELVIQVCEAVQHAHQKGIIHRDLKPSNILVEIQDDRPVPKIIDFGVARAIDRQLSERTLFTEFGQLVGTPEYMSPEQAEMTGLDIDTRTDVYSLGVVLYELLTGFLPFDPRELRQAGFDEIRRRIREETPPKPSTRVSTAEEGTEEAAGRRRSDPTTLARRVRGDLDWITMKALEKDRTRRYASASELAADLRRHLASEPVTAGPPSAAYRVRKFVRRHQVGVGAAAALAALFVAGFAGTAYGLVRALRAERHARLEAATSQRISDFMLRMFEINDPGEARGNEVTAREILDAAAERIRIDLAAEPELQGRLMEAMGKVYRSLGLYRDATPLLGEAVGSFERAYGPESRQVAMALTTLSGLLIKRGRGEEALPHLERARRIENAVLPPDDPQRGATLNNLGNVHRLAGRWDEAAACYEEALRIREAALGPDHPDVAKMLNQLGLARQQQGDLAGADAALRRAVAIRERRLGPDHPDLAAALNNLAGFHRKIGDHDAARQEALRAIAIQDKVLDTGHPDRVNTLMNLGLIEKEAGRLAEARGALERALPIARETRHRFLSPLLGFLAEICRDQGETARADALEAERQRLE